MSRRSYGTGSLLTRTERATGPRGGLANGKWRHDGRQVMRKIGPKRTDGTRQGLTRTQAESRAAGG